MKKSKSIHEYILAGASALLVALLLPAAPFNLTGKAALLSACVALPEGGYTLFMSYMSSNVSNTVEEETEKEVKKKTIIFSDDFTETPPDIAELIAQANKKTEKKDGDISARTYGRSSATSSFENILVRNTTDTKSLNIEKTLNEDLGLAIEDRTKPCVLIYHTHTTEGFEMLDRDWYASDASSRTPDVSKNIVRVGDEIENQLREHGFNVIHDETVYDTKYSGAYKRSRASVEKYLEQYPGILITLDVHRDAIQENNGTKIKPIANINGKKAAQIMIITGAQEGDITDYPNWQYNLRFALHIQQSCENFAKGLMRPIMFCQRKYNMDITPYSLLVEIGSEANTLDEATYSARLFGAALANLLEEYVT